MCAELITQAAAADERHKSAVNLVADTLEDKQKVEAAIMQLNERLDVLSESVTEKKDVLPQIDAAENLAREAVAWASKRSLGIVVPTKETVSGAQDNQNSACMDLHHSMACSPYC